MEGKPKSGKKSFESRIWDIITDKFSQYLNFPLNRPTIGLDLMNNNFNTLTERRFRLCSINNINRVFYILSQIENIRTKSFLESVNIPITRDVPMKDLNDLKRDIMDNIVMEVFTTDFIPMDDSHPHGRSNYLTEFYLYYYMYYAIFKELESSSPVGYVRSLVTRDEVANYFSSGTTAKMWGSRNLELKNLQSFSNIRKDLKRLSSPYAFRALWYLENVYGVNKFQTAIPSLQYGPSPPTNNFDINPNFNLGKLPTQLSRFILLEKPLNGHFPFNLPSGYVRTSRFGRKLNIKGDSIKLDSNIFNQRYLVNFIKRSNIKVTLASDPATLNLVNRYQADKLLNLPTRIKLISLASKFRHHDMCVRKALINVDNAVVIELPVFDPKTHILTGI